MLCVVSLLDSYFFMLKHFIIGRFLFKRHFLDCFHYIYVPPSYRGAQGVMSFILMSNLSAVSSLPWIRKTIFFLFSPFLLPWGGIQVHIHFKWGKLSHSINSTNYFRIKDFFFPGIEWKLYLAWSSYFVKKQSLILNEFKIT